MASDIGDYLSRFEQMEKTRQAMIQVQQIQANNLAGLLSVQQSQADRTDRMDKRIDQLGTKVDDLVGAIRSLIDRIPPHSLQSRQPRS